MVRLNVPPETGFPHVLVAEYVPAIVELVTPVAVPEMESVQDGCKVVNVTVNVRVEPDRVPETVPLVPVPPAEALVTAVPETVEPD